MATEPIQININPESDGCYYELEPLSRRRVKAAYPEARMAPMVFIGYPSKADFEAMQGPIWPQIASVLTGLPWDHIIEMGGIEIYDVRDHRPVRHIPAREAA